MGPPSAATGDATVRVVVGHEAAAVAAVTNGTAVPAGCPPGSRNCVCTVWTAPAGTAGVAARVHEILRSYPRGGQNGIDAGGWTIAEGDLLSAATATTAGQTRLEYKSNRGCLAVVLNCGRRFIDDLVVHVDDVKVTLRSSSRMGTSDLGVNKKRLEFLAAKARVLGWEAPEPNY